VVEGLRRRTGASAGERARVIDQYTEALRDAVELLLSIQQKVRHEWDTRSVEWQNSAEGQEADGCISDVECAITSLQNAVLDDPVPWVPTTGGMFPGGKTSHL
jgi:hypothetical protein